jgi:hypothetical protein
MALTEADIADAGAIVRAAATVRAAIPLLRARFPDMRASVVDPFDMRGEEPSLRVGQRALFLASTDGHCWTVTRNVAAASAFVLTEGS